MGKSKGSPEVVTAVLDTGYLPHPDLVGNILPGYSFISDVEASNNGKTRGADATDPGDWVTQTELEDANGPFYRCMATARTSSWHGTRAASVIGAMTNNADGIAGISWFGKVLPVRVLGKCGGVSSDIADGMRWAAGLPVSGAPGNPNAAKVINLSLGSPGPCSQTFQSAVDDVMATGAIVVVAAGNDGQLATNQQPANCRGVIAVGATDRNGRRTSFSNFGGNAIVSAPGVDIMQLTNDGVTAPGNNSYGFGTGTSFSAPQVSGVVALMLSLNGSLSASRPLKYPRRSVTM